MSDYTPSTRAVRRAYVSGRVHRKEQMPMAAKAAFDRWLAEHDRQVAEAAWDECYNEMHDRFPYPNNPHRKESE